MAIEKGAIPITGFISPTDESDIYPTHKDRFGKGGHRSVPDYTALLAITEARRSEGMLVYVSSTKTMYQLVGGVSDNNFIPVYDYDENNDVVIENLKFPCAPDYVMVGNPAGQAQASPVLIDMRLDTNNIRTSRVVVEGARTNTFTEAVFLGEKGTGFLYNNGGNIAIEAGIPAGQISLAENKLLIGNNLGVAEARSNITLEQLPPLGEATYAPDLIAGQIWRGTNSDKAEASNALSIAEADILAINGRFALTHFVQNSRTLSSPFMPASQYLADLGGGMVKLQPVTGLFEIAIEGVDYGDVSSATPVSKVGNIAIWADTQGSEITDSGFSVVELEELAAEATAAAAASTAAATSSAASAAAATTSATAATTAATTATTAAGTAGTEAAAALTSAQTATLAAETAATSATSATTAAGEAIASATTTTTAAAEATAAAATATGAAGEATASATITTTAAAEATAAAATATGAAGEATASAATATGAAGTAAGAAAAAVLTELACSASSSSASSSASSASTSAAEASTFASNSAGSAAAAAATYATILSTGLNSLPNNGNINFAGYKGINVADPSNAQDIATKSYVDAIASGMSFHNTAVAATTENLTATYNNGTAGTGATLTNNGTLAAFSVDSITPVANSRILVKNQTTALQNGIYTLTTVGSGSVAWVLTRASDYNSPPEVSAGDIVPVENGAVNGKTSWLQTATVVTIGTDPVLFTQFSYAPTSFLQVASNLLDLSNVSEARTNLGLTAVATQSVTTNAILQGGANNSIASRTLTDGQLLIGRTGNSPTSASPTNGTNISWTGGTGTLTANLAGQVAVANGGTGVSSVTIFGLLCGGSTPTSNLQSLGAGNAGQVLTSAGIAAVPTWQTPTTGTVTSVTAGTGLSGGAITTSGTIALANTAVTAASYTLGNFTVDAQGRLTAASSTSTVPLANGGTNASLTANNGGIFFSTATAGAILAGTTTAGRMLRSGATAAPSWSTATFPATTVVSQILYSSATNVVSGLATANSGTLITSTTGVPSISSTLPPAVQSNITGLGTITTGVWNGTTIAVANGGTGATSTTSYGIVCGGTTATGALQNAGAGLAGQIYVSGGASALGSWQSITAAGGASTSAKYILQTSDASLTNAQSLGSLATGILKNATTTGVLSIATAGTDYYSAGNPFTVYTDSNNFYLGVNCGNNTFGSSASTGFGTFNLFAITSGQGNSAFGSSALRNLTTSNYNTAMGVQSLWQITTLSNLNTSIGYAAGSTRLNYSQCTFLGGYADASVNNLTNSTAIGANTLVSIDNSVVIGNNCNVGIGTSDTSAAGLTVTRGPNDGQGDTTCLSLYATGGNGAKLTLQAFSGSAAVINRRADGVLYITNGYVATVSSTKFAVSGAVAEKLSGNTWANPSDARIKNIVRNYDKGISELLKIQPKVFTFNELSGASKKDRKKENIGIIAQEIEEFLPECISVSRSKNNKVKDMRIYDANAITYLLINSVKELHAELNYLKQQFNNSQRGQYV